MDEEKVTEASSQPINEENKTPINEEKPMENTMAFVTPVIEPNGESKESVGKIFTERPEKKKRKTATIFKVLAIILVIIAILGAVWFFVLKPSNQKLVVGAFDSLKSQFDYFVDTFESPDRIEEKYTYSGIVDFNVQSGLVDEEYLGEEAASYQLILDKINALKLQYALSQNSVDSKTSALLKILGNDEELFGLKLYADKANTYFYLDNLFEKYISLETSLYRETENGTITIDDIDYLYEKFMKSLKDNLKDEYFTETKEEITFEGEKISTVKHSLKLNSDNIYEIEKGIVADLKEDSKTKNIIKIINADFENYEPEKAVDQSEYTINIYTTGLFDKVVKLDLVSIEDDLIISYYLETAPRLEMIENEIVIADVKLVKEGKSFTIDGTVDTLKLTLKYTKETDESNTVAEMSVGDIKLTANINNKVKEITKNEKYESQIKVTMSIMQSQFKIGDLIINVNGEITKGATIDENIKDSVLIGSLTEEDMLSIQTKLQENLMNYLMSAE